MNSSTEFKTRSSSPKTTEQLGQRIGAQLKGGEVLELVGDLGSGKTTFVRGLAKGMGSLDHVASPTFTISRLYKAGRLSLHHLDFYRLAEAGIMSHEIKELVLDRNNVIVIEWADVTHDVLPSQRLIIRFATKDESHRGIKITYPKQLDYIFKE